MIKQYLIFSVLLFSCSEAKIINDNNKYTRDNLPDNAVKIENDLYYIPIGKDKDNCLMFRAYSEKYQVLAAIIYRNKNKKFNLNKDKNTCL